MKRIKRTILVMLVITGLLFNPVLAATAETQETNAGVTPDSIFYTFDLLFEDLQLTLSSSPESESKRLLEFAQERLAEAKEMSEEEKYEFVQEAVYDYLEKYQQSVELITGLVIEENVDEDILESLKKKLDESAEINDKVEEYLESEGEALKEKIDNAHLVANVIKDLNKEQVISLREKGMGYGQISQVFALSQYTGKSVEEIAVLFTGEDVGFSKVSKLLGVSPSSFRKNTAKIKEDNEESLVNTPVADGLNTETVDSNISAPVKKTIEETTDYGASRSIVGTRTNSTTKTKSIINTENSNGLTTGAKSINEKDKENIQNKENAQKKENVQNKENAQNKENVQNKESAQNKENVQNKESAQNNGNAKDKAKIK